MIVMDNEAPRFDGYYVRVERNAAKTELNIGVAQGGKPALISRYPIWNVPVELVESARALATLVETFASEQRVHNLCDMSDGLRRHYKLCPGEEVHGEVITAKGDRAARAKQKRADKVQAGAANGAEPAGV